MALSNEDVCDAADELVRDGELPTWKSIRIKLGGGSYKTIQAGVKEWRTRQAMAASLQAREPMPESFNAILAEAGQAFWCHALKLAASRIEDERSVLATIRAEVEESRDEAAALADQLADELDMANAKVADLEHLLERERSGTVVLREQLSASEARSEELSKLCGSLHEQKEEADRRLAKALADTLDIGNRFEALAQRNAELLERMSQR